jgi:hypothetical protein
MHSTWLPLHLSIPCSNNVALAAGDYLIHLYADDTILYTSGPSLDTVLTYHQTSFNAIQHSFRSLQLLLNAIWQQSLPHSCRQTYPCEIDYPTNPWFRQCHLQNRLHPVCWVECWRLSQSHPFCHQSPIYYPPLWPVCSHWLALTTYPLPNPLAGLSISFCKVKPRFISAHWSP